MRIIIDGCDWTWKTTLVNFLSEKLWLEIKKFSVPKTKNPFEEFIEFYKKDSNKYIWDNCILDRCWISEMIYWPIKWRKWLTTLERNKFIQKTKDDLYIICFSSDFSTIKKVFKERWEDYINLKEAEKINKKFFTKWLNLWKKINILFFDFYKHINNLEEYFTLFIKNKLWK